MTTQPSPTGAVQRSDFRLIALLVAEEAGALVSAGYRTHPRRSQGPPRSGNEYDRNSEALLVARLGALTPSVRGGRGAVLRRARWAWKTRPLLVRRPARRDDELRPRPPLLVRLGGPDRRQSPHRRGRGRALARSALGRLGGRASAEGRATTSTGAAYRNGRACVVSTTEAFDSALVATGFPPNRDAAPANNFASFIAVKHAARAVRRCGSAAINLCMVADGTYDAYWERRLGVWDVAAGCAGIIIAAGGRITALDGGAPAYHVGHVAVSNTRVHGELLAALARSERDMVGR